MSTIGEFPLHGAGGEPISFTRTIHSHGLAVVPPASAEGAPLVYRRRLRAGKRVFELVLSERKGRLIARAESPLGARAEKIAVAAIQQMFRFGDNLAPFYLQIADDERLAWAAIGAGRILASPSVFEDVVKTICTTNCTWSATIRMTTALAALGEGAFPDAARLAQTPESWFRDVARMGYRGPYVAQIARDVADGKFDLEALLSANGMDDAAVEARLLALPGIGPYGAAHVMQLVGRHRRLVLDSWTRPKFLRLTGKKRAADSTIRRAFARYGDHAGLAFWLFLTRDWVGD